MHGNNKSNPTKRTVFIMKIESQFSAYLALCRTEAEKAYVQGRLLPALGALWRKSRRLRAAQLWLTASAAIVALLLPLLASLPLPDGFLRLAAAPMGAAIAAVLFAQQLLGLPARAAHSELRCQQLIRLTHAYFLSAQEFSNLSDEEKLERLFSEAEALFA